MQVLVPLLIVGLGVAIADEAPRPNIIFFMADDLGWNNVQWHNPEMKTPHATQLVKEGIEFDRHYAFLYCSPSRSSFMTGRLPFHVQQVNFRNSDLAQGAPRNMTTIAAKLKQAGYATVAVGKWHLGMSSWGHIPQGRGFDSSLGYFEGAEDHWNQRSCLDGECIVPVPNSSYSPHDLWLTDHPASGIAGTSYSGYLFNNFAVDAILSHDGNAGPLFMYLAPANSHTPLQVPDQYLDLYPSDWYLDRRQYAGMCSFWDEVLGNVTQALKDAGLWNTTLFVFSSDNGGPAYWSTTADFQHGSGANNWPLKGSKVSNWEGGTRVAAFASGGFLPNAVRGTKLSEYIHMADWYSTFCYLAGVDPTDTVAEKYGLPPIDSLNMWPLLSGAVTVSPRQEIPLCVNFTSEIHSGNVSALISGDWKILVGVQLLSYWQGPEFPNATSAPYGVISDPALQQECSPACLFNIRQDPTEQVDLALVYPDRVTDMLARLVELGTTHFQQISDPKPLECMAQVIRNGNFMGPWLP